MEYRENRDARKPFLSTPDSRVYFPASAIEEARLSTSRCLRRNEGVALVVGATGTGKTLLTRVLAAEFEAESLVAVVAPTRRIDAKSFWQQFLFSLRQTFCGCDETELRLMALDYLERSQRRHCVLLIDDAQNLPFRVFDELRSFIDQGAAAASQICVALFGTTVLEERLNLPPLYPFQQRIVSRSYLDPFERAEIADYIDSEARRVGGKFVFSKSAKETVADLCKGAPRVVNQLCDRALFLKAQEQDALFGNREFVENNGCVDFKTAIKRTATESANFAEIDAPLIERAWARLLNLPEDEPKVAASGELSSVIEFGTLEDDEDDYNDCVEFSGSVVSDDGESNENNAINNVGLLDANSEIGEKSEVKTFEENEGFNVEFDESDVCFGNVERRSNALDSDCKGWEDCEVQEEENELDDEDAEDEEIDAALEARLLQNLKHWETTKDEENFDVGEKTKENGEVSNGADRWERADALKERLNVDEREELRDDSTSVVAIAPVASTLEEAEDGEGRAWREDGATLPTPQMDDESAGEKISDVKNEENDAPAAEKRVFEALKSEYFNDGFLFEFDDAVDLRSEKTEKTTAENKRKRTKKTTSKTRRPIEGDDDGSRLWNEVNGRGVDEKATTDDERFRETRLTADRVAARSVSETEAETERAAADWENEFVSLEDRAYEQIVEDCWKTTGNFDASDEYLSELSLLEQEIEEEANLVRRIRNIHLRLRSARAAVGRKRRRDVEKTDDASTGVETTNEDEKFDDATLNY